MLDIMDRDGKVVAVILDDGTVVKKKTGNDDVDKLIKEKVSKLAKEGNKR